MTPGPYQAGLWADVRSPNPSSPPFSPVTATSGVTTLSFPEPATNYHGDSLWSSTSSFLYESSLVTITLGRRVWSLRQPVYGFNGIVQGAVRLSGKCTHVVRMEVSVETAFIHPPTWGTADRFMYPVLQLLGKVKVTSSERGLISEHVNRNLLTSAVVLSCPPRDGFTSTEESFPFNIPFPSHVAGGSSPLPPSCAWWSSTFSTEVEYCVRVDVHRKGWRRHEVYVLSLSCVRL